MTYQTFLLVRRNPNVSHQAFKEYIDNHHVPTVAALTSPLFPSLNRRYYIQPLSSGLGILSDSTYDMIVAQEFDSEDQFKEYVARCSTPDAAEKLKPDAEYLGQTELLVVTNLVQGPLMGRTLSEITFG
jgi:hypothetical protein